MKDPTPNPSAFEPEDDQEIEGASPVQVEQAMRWRLILGRFSEDRLGYDRLQGACGLGEGEGVGLGGMMAEARRMEAPLEYIYDREHAKRSHRQASPGGGGGLSVPAWLKSVRELFPQEAVQVMEGDALHRYGMKELVTDAEILRNAEPTEDLLKAILQFKHMMKGDVLKAAREVIDAVVKQLADKLLNDCGPALHGVVDPDQRPPMRTFRNTDWRKTVRRNLKNWDPEQDRLVVERVFFKHRQKKKSAWDIIIAVDQSGSMTDSLIHSAVMAGIFASLPSVSVKLILWDHRVMDVSHLVDDPLEILMGCQLGGGTQMLPAMQYSAGLITEPTRTLFVLLSDWYVWGEQEQCLAMAHALREAGVTCIGLSALDADCRPIFDERFARQLADCGWFVAALTPRKLAEHVGKILA